jgi:hypothetical protein
MTVPALGADKVPAKIAKGEAVLWHDPHDIRSRDLVYGIGGRAHAPHGPFKFLKEDLSASSPKYSVRDRDGVKWKVKLGAEAKPETAASRIVWAAGYYTAEDYYLPTIQVDGVPAQLHRGREWVDADGTMRGARLKREPDSAKKLDAWKWKQNPFIGTREFDGLRALMGVINNWDVKDENNALYREGGELVYLVSDLGATFGAPGFSFPARKAKSNLEQYRAARFLCEVGRTTVDFCAPGRTGLPRLVDVKGFVYRWRLRWIGHDIPRADARWIGEILARLSPAQIRDAFRTAGYAPDEVEGFARVLEHRIGELSEL